MTLPHPKIWQTRSGALGLTVILGLSAAYVTQPPLRPVLDAACGPLVYMLPAALGGMLLRVGHDLQAGKNRINTYAWQHTLGGLAMVITAIWATMRAITYVPDDLIAQLASFAVLAIVVGIAAAGYADGDDETWRQTQYRHWY